MARKMRRTMSLTATMKLLKLADSLMPIDQDRGHHAGCRGRR